MSTSINRVSGPISDTPPSASYTDSSPLLSPYASGHSGSGRIRNLGHRNDDGCCTWICSGMETLCEGAMYNWRSLVLLFFCTVSCSGEIILRKSVLTNGFNYRWFFIQISFLCTLLFHWTYLAIFKWNFCRCCPCTNHNHKNRVLSTSERLELQNEGGDAGNIGGRSSHSVVSISRGVSSLSNDDSGSNLSLSGSISSIGWRPYCIMSVLDVLHVVFVVIPIGVLHGSIVSMIPLLSIPLSITLNCCVSCDTEINVSFFDIRTLIASCITLIGLYCTVFWTNDKMIVHHPYLANVVLMIVGCIPLVFSDMYKRSLLLRVKVDLDYFNMFLSFLCFILCWICVPIAFKIQYIELDKSWSVYSNFGSSFDNFKNGLKCLFGVSSAMDDVCHDVPALLIGQWLCYEVCVLANRMLGLRLVKESMSTFSIQTTIIIGSALSFLLFSVDGVRMLYHEAVRKVGLDGGGVMDYKALIGLCLVVAGSLVAVRRFGEPVVEVNSDDVWLEREQH